MSELQRRTFSVQYDSGIAEAEHGLARKADTVTPIPLRGRQDGDNFVTNRVSLQEHSDNAGAAGAMGLSTVWACVNLIAGTQSSLPVGVYRSVRGRVDEEEWDHPLYRVLSESPNADQSPLDFLEFMSGSVEFHGNGYSEVERGTGGRIIALDVPVAPELMTVRRISDGSLQYEWYDRGKRRVVPQERMVHVRGFGGNPLGGLSTLEFARRTFRLATSIEVAADQTFRNGVRPSGLLSVEKALNKDQRREAEQLLQEKFVGAVNAGRPMLLDNAMKWEQLSINPEDAQMLESRAFSVEEICRWFGTPPHLIGHTQGNTTLGSSIEQQTLHFIVFSLRRRLKRFEQAFDKQLLTPADRARGLKIKFSLQGLLRGDSKARADFYQSALQNGWMTINEVRELENLPPVAGGDVPRMQMQNVPITEAAGVVE